MWVRYGVASGAGWADTEDSRVRILGCRAIVPEAGRPDAPAVSRGGGDASARASSRARSPTATDPLRPGLAGRGPGPGPAASSSPRITAKCAPSLPAASSWRPSLRRAEVGPDPQPGGPQLGGDPEPRDRCRPGRRPRPRRAGPSSARARRRPAPPSTSATRSSPRPNPMPGRRLAAEQRRPGRRTGRRRPAPAAGPRGPRRRTRTRCACSSRGPRTRPGSTRNGTPSGGEVRLDALEVRRAGLAQVVGDPRRGGVERRHRRVLRVQQPQRRCARGGRSSVGGSGAAWPR